MRNCRVYNNLPLILSIWPSALTVVQEIWHEIHSSTDEQLDNETGKFSRFLAAQIIICS